MSGQRYESRCPKCGGSMFIYNDFYGWYEQCLQCSFTRYLDTVYENGEKTVARAASGIDLTADREVKD